MKQDQCWIKLGNNGKIIRIGARCKKKDFRKSVEKIRKALKGGVS